MECGKVIRWLLFPFFVYCPEYYSGKRRKIGPAHLATSDAAHVTQMLRRGNYNVKRKV